MRLGTAKADITPSWPVRLAGYGDRPPLSEGVDQGICLRVHAYEEGSERLVICYADILWFNPEAVPLLRDALRERGIDPSCVIFAASHNHSAPGTGSCFTALLESLDQSWRDLLISSAASAAEKALGSMEEVRLSYASSELDLNVFRRKMVNGHIEMVPDYSVPADRHFTIIKAERPDGSIKGLMVHYPCHANLTKANRISGDYPGCLLSMLDAQTGGISLFLQGCTADLRPNSVIGNLFTPASRDEVERFASVMASEAMAMAGRTVPLPGKVLSPERRELLLPLDQKGLMDQETESEAGRQWAELVRAKGFRPYEKLFISYSEIGGIPLLFYSAEMAQDYAAFAREHDPEALSVGYSDGMTGYISTAREIDEGGYEPAGSAVYFALAGTFSRDIEKMIRKEIDSLMRRKNGRRERD